LKERGSREKEAKEANERGREETVSTLESCWFALSEGLEEMRSRVEVGKRERNRGEWRRRR
jgi:hypothetical protein